MSTAGLGHGKNNGQPSMETSAQQNQSLPPPVNVAVRMLVRELSQIGDGNRQKKNTSVSEK